MKITNHRSHVTSTDTNSTYWNKALLTVYSWFGIICAKTIKESHCSNLSAPISTIFGPQKNILRGRHFPDADELKTQRAWRAPTLYQRDFHDRHTATDGTLEKRVDCEGEFMEKSVNAVPMVYVKLIIIVLVFSEKNMSNYYFIFIYRWQDFNTETLKLLSTTDIFD